MVHLLMRCSTRCHLAEFAGPNELSKTCEIITRSREIITRSREIITIYREIITRSHDYLICCMALMCFRMMHTIELIIFPSMKMNGIEYIKCIFDEKIIGFI